MPDTPTLELMIHDNSEKAIEGLKSLASHLRTLKESLAGGLGVDKIINDLSKLNKKFNTSFSDETVNNITKVAESLERLQKASNINLPDLSYGNNRQPIGPESKPVDMPIAFQQPDTSAFDQARDKIAQSVGDMNATIAEVDTMPLQEAAVEANESLATTATEIGNVGRETATANEQVTTFARTLRRTRQNADGASGGFHGLMKTLGNLISPLNKIIKSFNRILFYRVIRSVIKEISKGLSEGISNVRAYSKAINGSFNAAMTNAENALFKMKNSIGAALAPAIEGLIPYIQSAVSWFINLLNIANQFFALMNGQSEWTRAIDASAASFEKQKKAASGAAKEVKNLLAGFDELNIIQSESGGNGGGSGSAAAADYTKAFEQVTQFDGKIREFVKWLKKNTDSIYATAGAIAASIFGWRVSKGFEGILGKLGSIIAFGGTIFLEWELTSKFSGEYLKSGDLGWLVADVLTAVVGAFLGQKLAKQVFGEGAGAVGVSIMLTVSALADIVASIRNADVSALSKENIINTLLASIKMGTAGVFLAKFFNFATADALKIGGGAALVTFGVAMGIKATAEAINSDDFSNEDFIKAKAMSSISMGAGAALLGTKLFNLSAGQAIGEGVGVALVTFGAYTAIKAIADAVKSDDFTKVKLSELAEISAELGIGSGIMYKSLGGDIRGSFELSGGAALVTFGVVSGIHAVLRAEKVGYDKAFFGDLAKSSLGIGAGSALIALALGAPASVVGIVGGLAAVITVGAIVAVAAVLQPSKEEDGIKWGDYVATEAEIQAFVNKKMFTVDVETQLQLINSKVSATQVERENISDRVSQLFSDLNTLRLGVDIDTSLTNIGNQVLGPSGDGSDETSLIGRIRALAEKEKVLLKTTFSIMPLYDDNGKEVTGEYLKDFIDGWDLVDQGVTELGTLLSKHLSEAAKDSLSDELKQFEIDAIKDITTTLNNIALGVTSGNIEAEAVSTLTFSLGDLEEKSAKKVMQLFGEYRDKLTTGYKDAYMQAAMSFKSQANRLNELAIYWAKQGDEAKAKAYEVAAKDAMDRYDELTGEIDKTVNDAVNRASEQGTTKIQKTLKDVYGDAFEGIVENFQLPSMGEVVAMGLADSDEELVEAIAEGWKEKIFDLIDLTEEDLKSYNIDVMSLMPTTLKEAMLTKVANTYGLEIADALAASIGATVPEEVRTAIEEAIKEAERVRSENAIAAAKIAWAEDEDATRAAEDAKYFAKKQAILDAATKAAEAAQIKGERLTRSLEFEAEAKRKADEFNAEVDYYEQLFTNQYANAKLQELKDKSLQTALDAAFTTANGKVEVVPMFSDEWWQAITNNVTSAFEQGASEVNFNDFAPVDVVPITDEETELLNQLYADIAALNGDISKQKEAVENYKRTINSLWEIRMNPDKYSKEMYDWASKLIYDENDTGVYAKYRETTSKLAELEKKAQEIQKQIDEIVKTPEDVVISKPDTTDLIETMDNTASTVNSDVNDIIRDLERLNSFQYNVPAIGGSLRGSKLVMKAGGGFVGTGDMFIAREAGPELVGRIGSKTAVANNDQIVQGVAGGVAAGQSEQNSLLRAQNDLLRAILSKSGNVRVTPNAGWGRFFQESNEMYAANTGV